MHLRYSGPSSQRFAGGSVHHVQAVFISCHPVSPVSLPGRTEPCFYYTTY